MRLLNSVLAILSNNRFCQVQSIAFSADPLCPITYTHSPDLLLAPSMATTVLLVLQLVDLFPFSIHPFTVTRRILKLVFCLISMWTCLPYPTHIMDSVVDEGRCIYTQLLQFYNCLEDTEATVKQGSQAYLFQRETYRDATTNQLSSPCHHSRPLVVFLGDPYPPPIQLHT
jgi:hypothetical protein